MNLLFSKLKSEAITEWVSISESLILTEIKLICLNILENMRYKPQLPPFGYSLLKSCIAGQKKDSQRKRTILALHLAGQVDL